MGTSLVSDGINGMQEIFNMEQEVWLLFCSVFFLKNMLRPHCFVSLFFTKVILVPLYEARFLWRIGHVEGREEY